jgi:hypothetical protein
MVEPQIDDHRVRTGRSVRRSAGAAVALTAAILFGAVPAAAGPPGPQPVAVIAPGEVPPPPPIPGTDTGVQRWFKAREADQIELNNALDLAKQLPRQAGAARPICLRLARVALAMDKFRRVPVAALDSPLRAGLTDFGQAAAACLTGDLAKAERLVAAGLAARTAASDRIDALLEGE